MHYEPTPGITGIMIVVKSVYYVRVYTGCIVKLRVANFRSPTNVTIYIIGLMSIDSKFNTQHLELTEGA